MTDNASKKTKPEPLTSDEAAISVAVSQRIAALRKSREFTFDALAQRAKVSKGTLVQIEQGRANPSISTLCRLAATLGVSVSDLVSPVDNQEAVAKVVGPEAARVLWTGPNGGTATLLAGTKGPDMLELWQWVLMPGEHFDSSRHARGTRELISVTEGILHLEVQGQSNLVSAGSSAMALTDRPHAYSNRGSSPVKFWMSVHEPTTPL